MEPIYARSFNAHYVYVTSYEWENVIINWRINFISDSFEILWWAQLWFNKI